MHALARRFERRQHARDRGADDRQRHRQPRRPERDIEVDPERKSREQFAGLLATACSTSRPTPGRHDRQHQRLDEQLGHDSRPAGPERRADRELRGAGRGAGEDQDADVRAREREQENRERLGDENPQLASGLSISVSTLVKGITCGWSCACVWGNWPAIRWPRNSISRRACSMETSFARRPMIRPVGPPPGVESERTVTQREPEVVAIGEEESRPASRRPRCVERRRSASSSR